MKLESQGIEIYGYTNVESTSQKAGHWTPIKYSALRTIVSLRKNKQIIMIYAAPFLIVLFLGYMRLLNIPTATIAAIMSLPIVSAIRYIWAILAMDFRYVRDLEAEDEMR
jgi:presenilin-like A22 family membrane protease